jgi:ketosteroid isomerase-like protein
MTPPGTTKRDLLDWLVIQAPGVAGSIRGGVVRLKPGSPIRRRLLNLLVKRAFAAMARSDVELLLSSYDPNVEVWMRSMSGVGISQCYRGHDGIRALYADLDEAFDGWWWTIRSVVDGGDRIAVRTDFVGYGRGSGAETTVTDGGTAIRLSDRGQATWQEWFAEQGGWTKALKAVGLSE